MKCYSRVTIGLLTTATMRSWEVARWKVRNQVIAERNMRGIAFYKRLFAQEFVPECRE